MKYTQIPVTTWQQIQLNAGILVDNFNPETGVIGNILGATTGGVKFTDTPTYNDFGEDIDNCPKNMMELKRLESREVKIAGTFVTLSPDAAKKLVGSADVDKADATHIIPRNHIEVTDFETLWWIGDYSNVNTGDNAGYVAVKMLNALNTSGLSIQSTDKAKGNFAFEFTGHYSIEAQDVVPYEFYVKQGVSLINPALMPEDGTTELFGELVSNMQTNVAVANGAITGTLAFIEGGLATSGPLAGDGHFLALKFVADDWTKYTSVKVGLDPSQGTGMVEVINDPDKNGVFKITDTNQVLIITSTDGTETITNKFSLKNLVLATEG